MLIQVTLLSNSLFTCKKFTRDTIFFSTVIRNNKAILIPSFHLQQTDYATWSQQSVRPLCDFRLLMYSNILYQCTVQDQDMPRSVHVLRLGSEFCLPKGRIELYISENLQTQPQIGCEIVTQVQE